MYNHAVDFLCEVNSEQFNPVNHRGRFSQIGITPFSSQTAMKTSPSHNWSLQSLLPLLVPHTLIVPDTKIVPPHNSSAPVCVPHINSAPVSPPHSNGAPTHSNGALTHKVPPVLALT